jgi:hypothetical protein
MKLSDLVGRAKPEAVMLWILTHSSLLHFQEKVKIHGFKRWYLEFKKNFSVVFFAPYFDEFFEGFSEYDNNVLYRGGLIALSIHSEMILFMIRNSRSKTLRNSRLGTMSPVIPIFASVNRELKLTTVTVP